MLTSCYEYEIPTHIKFIDFKSAYDMVNRQKMVNTLKSLKIPLTLANLINMTLKNTRCAIRDNSKSKMDSGRGTPYPPYFLT